MITAAAAIAIAVVLGTLPAVNGGNRQSALVVFSVIGVAATLIALSGRTPATRWAVTALGSEYAVSIFGRDTIDVRAPIVGAGLLVLAELIHWSIRAQTSVGNEAGMGGRQLVDLGALWLGSLALGSFVVALGDLGGRGGLGLTIAGVVASAATLGLVLVLAWRPRKVDGRLPGTLGLNPRTGP
ncbi:MAG: hypothetical protein M3P11_13710 [Actinomycetota bacterium]|nr:hypothetical protein [Actinomycetota bacterium]